MLYTQPTILNDLVPAERKMGIDAGLAWKTVAHYWVVYIDKGISTGMQEGIDAAISANIPVKYRCLELINQPAVNGYNNAIAQRQSLSALI